MKGIGKLAIAGVLGVASACAMAQLKSTFIEESQMWGSATADYNGDGEPDIFITGHDHNDRIWYWTSAGYVPSAQVLQWSDRHDCDAADVDQDGRIDFYCAVGAVSGTGTGLNELWMQQPDGTHVKAVSYGAEDPFGRGRIPKFFNFNGDNYPDIYLANLPQQRADGMPNINRVFVNQRNGTFVEAETTATGAVGSLCVDTGDIDKNGGQDLLVCAESAPGRLYLNTRNGNFTVLAPPASQPWIDGKLVDINADGYKDLVVLEQGNRLRIWLNTRTSPYFTGAPWFEDKLPNTAVSLAVGDFDRNGRNDVYVVLVDSRCMVTHLDAAPDVLYKGQRIGKPVKVAFTQAEQNFPGCGHKADAVGSKVLVMQGGGAWIGPSYLLDLADVRVGRRR